MLEKVAYIKGLLQGMKLNDEDPYKELFVNIVDVLEDMAAAIADAEDNIIELDEYIQEIDEDLDAVECFLDEELDEEYEDEDDYYSIVCPTCNEEFSVDDEVAELGKINCPNCGESLEFDLSDLECDGDCECCCEEDAE
jgi:DNA-directed RNA polymerase subunit RPC12/RpoP